MDTVESMSNCLSGKNLVLNNGNRLTLPLNIHFVFELESIEELHPGLICHLSLVCCDHDKEKFIKDGWKVYLNKVCKNSPGKKLLSILFRLLKLIPS